MHPEALYISSESHTKNQFYGNPQSSTAQRPIMTNTPGTEQWREYPLNMAGFDPVCMDGELEHGRIDLRSKDLFDEISESTLEVLESGGQGLCHLLCVCTSGI